MILQFLIRHLRITKESQDRTASRTAGIGQLDNTARTEHLGRIVRTEQIGDGDRNITARTRCWDRTSGIGQLCPDSLEWAAEK
jgi:hypothetical protein